MACVMAWVASLMAGVIDGAAPMDVNAPSWTGLILIRLG